MNILVYDHNKDIVNTIVEELRDYNKEYLFFNITGINHQDDLITNIKTKKYDVAYLDIGVDIINKSSVVDDIKKLNNDCLIIFMTEQYQYIYDLFDERIFHYLYKPIEHKQFEIVLKKVVEIYKKNHSLYYFNTVNGKISFLPSDILYIETYYDNLKIMTKDKSYYSNIKNAKNIKDILKAYNFIQIHQSYFVNMNSILKIDKDVVVLNNEDELPLSVYKKKKVIEMYNDYKKKKEE